VKYWEVIADNLSKADFSLGWVSALDVEGRTIWIVDAHGYGKRSIVRTEEILNSISGTGTGDSPVCGKFGRVKAGQRRADES